MTLAVILSSFFSGLLGAMGLGGGTVLVVYLTYFSDVAQKEAQGINLICFIPVALIAVTVYSKQKLTDKKIILPFIIYGVVGAVSGFLLLEVLPQGILIKLFGGFLIVLSLKGLFTKSKK